MGLNYNHSLTLCRDVSLSAYHGLNSNKHQRNTSHSFKELSLHQRCPKDIMRATNVILNFQVDAFKQVKKKMKLILIFLFNPKQEDILASTCNNCTIMNYIFYTIHYTKTLWCVIFTLLALSQIGPHFKCSTFTCC